MQKNSAKKIVLAGERGAMIIEFTLAALFFFVFLFGIFEISRVLAVRALIIKGAQDAAILASQLPDIDIVYPVDGTGSPVVSSNEYRRYFNARQRVIDEAVRTPLGVFVATPVACPNLSPYPCETRPAGLKLQTLNTFDLRAPQAFGGGTIRMDAVLLRPDTTDIQVGYAHRDKFGNIVPDEPVIRYPSAFGLLANNATSLQRRLRDFPLVVEVHAQIEPITSFIPPIRLVGRATSFRESPPESSLSTLSLAPFPSLTSTTAPPTTAPPTTAPPTTKPTSTTVTTAPSTTVGSTTSTTLGSSTSSSTTTTKASTTTTAPTTTSTSTSTTRTTTTSTTTTTICPLGTPSRFISVGACLQSCSPMDINNFALCAACECTGG